MTAAEKVVSLETKIERLWREFVEARERSWATLQIEDGVAAGRAYGAFLHEFVHIEDRPQMGSPQ